MHRVRSIFLSDIHLGTRACQVERLLAFLRVYDAEYVYLLGDIIDFWSLGRGIYWPSLHNAFVQKMLKRARHEVNCGDWVDSCTAIVEHDDGRMELVHWRESEVPGEDLWHETPAVESPTLARVAPLQRR